MIPPGRCEKTGTGRKMGKGLLLFILIAIAAFTYRLTTVKAVTLVVDGESSLLSTRGRTVGEVLEEAGMHIRSRDLLKPVSETKVNEGMTIEIQRAFPVFLHYDGQTQLIYTTAQDVSALLIEQGLTPGLQDRIEPDPKTALGRGSDIRLTRVTTGMVYEEKAIPYKTVTRYDSSLPKGKRKVLKDGKTGVRLLTYEVTYADGVEEKRRLVGEKITEPPDKKVVVLGTAKPVPVVIASARGAEAGQVVEGIASWYGGGDGFNGTKTASGEVYNHSKLTAAHPYLAFGTIVRVTYVKTGRSVEVRINDRGPFGKNRILDLSKAAAEQIGLIGDGVGLVKIEVIK